jgi:hypothetical protein
LRLARLATCGDSIVFLLTGRAAVIAAVLASADAAAQPAEQFFARKARPRATMRRALFKLINTPGKGDTYCLHWLSGDGCSNITP